MARLEVWEYALLAIAGYCAVVVLVRLMIQRRNTLIGEFRVEMEQEKQRQQAEKQRKKKEVKQAAKPPARGRDAA